MAQTSAAGEQTDGDTVLPLFPKQFPPRIRVGKQLSSPACQPGPSSPGPLPGVTAEEQQPGPPGVASTRHHEIRSWQKELQPPGADGQRRAEPQVGTRETPQGAKRQTSVSVQLGKLLLVTLTRTSQVRGCPDAPLPRHATDGSIPGLVPSLPTGLPSRPRFGGSSALLIGSSLSARSTTSRSTRSNRGPQ